MLISLLIVLSVISFSSLGSENLILNADFKRISKIGLPYNWQIRPFKKTLLEKKCVSFKNNIVRLQTEDKGLRISFVQYEVPFVPGKDYLVSFKVRSSKKSNFRAYVEWMWRDKTGERSSKAINAKYQKANEEWTEKSFSVNVPSGYKPYLVFNIIGPAVVEISDIKVKEQKNGFPTDNKNNPSRELAILGGEWQNLRGARVFLSKDKKITLEIPNGKAKKSKGIIRGISLDPGQRYCLTFETWGIGKAGTDTGFFPFRVSAVFNDSIDCSGIWDDTWSHKQKKEFIFTAPKTSKKVNGKIIFESKSDGKILFDNFALKKIKPEPAEEAILIVNTPFFRDTIFAGSSEKNINGIVKINSKVKSATISLLDSEGKILNIKELDIQKQKNKFSFPAENLSYGKYKLSVKLENSKGKVFSIGRIINKLPPAKMSITCRSDRIICINGKPFFPIMLWKIFKDVTPVTLYHAARNGVNCFMARACTATSAKKILDLAAIYNMKVIISMGAPVKTKDAGIAQWEHAVSGVICPEVTEHPSLLGFFLVDEPAWVGKKLSVLKDGYQIIKELAPNHPIWINAAPRGTIKTHEKFSQAADIYGVDIYPVPFPSTHSGLKDKGLTSVGEYTKMMNKACNYRKPIWMALQCFAWGAWTKRARNIYPTYTESRFMAYDAILSGATGITYWGALNVEKRQFAESIYRLTKELWSLSGLLTLDDCSTATLSDNNNIKLKAWKYKGDIFIIAVNRSDKNQRVYFSGLTQNKKLNVLNENRKLSVKSKRFQDTFKPYEVHIYFSGMLPEPAWKIPEYNKLIENKDFFEGKKKVKYNGEAMWIWEESSRKKTWSKIGLLRKFNVAQKIKKATIIITADDNYKIYINGSTVGADISYEKGGWKTAEKYDCTKYLKNGENTMHITASDAGQIPCGVLVDLNIIFSDGSIKNIISDSNWLALKNPSPEWFKTKKNINTTKAVVVAAYGKGAWGRRVEINN